MLGVHAWIPFPKRGAGILSKLERGEFARLNMPELIEEVIDLETGTRMKSKRVL